MLHVIADEEMPVACFELRVARQSHARSNIEFGTYVIAVSRINPIARRIRSAPTPRRPRDVVKIVARIREPEAVAFYSYADARMRFDLKNRSDVMNVLQ